MAHHLPLDNVRSHSVMKAGHLPAERVGGRRIVNKKVNIFFTGASMFFLRISMEKSYPTSAVRHYHDKPQPTHQPHYANPPCHTSGHIFQPKKNC
ncbi:unnamed protein product [Angiostrongylus costaricensis]|uniref:Transmembrane protein n=1 Tax=Angiostrongylus costaricensis TaxID=334426 RepID=A0A0R3PU35_ANGCS|nr:unnamed protein product [Angiostrongylus costaricensis]